MLCVGCDGCAGCCVFCLYCEVWSCRCSYLGSVSVSSCRCCIFVSCVHPVAVLNAVFCMTCSLLMLVEDARGDHLECVFKRHSLQAVELSQRTQAAVQIVSNLPAPSNGGPIYRFLGMRTRWMAGAAAHKSG